MKKTVLLLFASMLVLAAFSPAGGEKKKSEDKAPESQIEWLTIDEAQARAATDPRPIFVDVYTNWCGWCKRMDKDTFSNPEVVEYVNNNYYAVKLNAESSDQISYKGEAMSQSRLAGVWRVRGYPTIVLLGSDLETVQPKAGYKKPSGFISMLKSFAN